MLDLVLHKATAAVRRASGSPPRYAQSQTDKKDYFLSLLNSLAEICSGKYRENFYLDQRTGKTYTNLNF